MADLLKTTLASRASLTPTSTPASTGEVRVRTRARILPESKTTTSNLSLPKTIDEALELIDREGYWLTQMFRLGVDSWQCNLYRNDTNYRYARAASPVEAIMGARAECEKFASTTRDKKQDKVAPWLRQNK